MEYQEFTRMFFVLSGIDLGLYKESQMKRRIDTWVARKGCSGYPQFFVMLQSKPDEYAEFLDYITINVTEFFRTPEHWKVVDDTVFAHLSSPFVWSVACSTGEEPYSLVISMAERMPLETIRVIATDIDERVLQVARQGVYSEKAVAAVPQQYLDKYFVKEGLRYRVIDEVKRCVEFRKMNLLSDELVEGCDLIVCRNVLIYFADEAKEYLYRSFLECLKPGGCLFTGNTEQIINYKELGYGKRSSYLYYKPRHGSL